MKHKHFTPKFLSCLGLGLLFTFGCSKEDLNPSENLSQRTSTSATDGSVSTSVVREGNQYIIISATDALPADIEGKARGANGKVTKLLSGVGIATATSDDPNFIAKASKISGVRSVIHDYTYQGYDPQEQTVEAANTNPPTSADNDPVFPIQWGHTAIQAPEAWLTGARGQNVRVAVLDGGFYLGHPDLVGNIEKSISFVPGQPAQFNRELARNRSTFSHGSHVAGTVAAVDNTNGGVGVAPDAKLILVKVLGDIGSGQFSWIIAGIKYAADEQVDVINMSLGARLPRNGKYMDNNGTPNDPSDDFLVKDSEVQKEVAELVEAINKVTTYAAKKGVTLIAAAGNDGIDAKDQNATFVPADSKHVISISATAPYGLALDPNTSLDQVAYYSNYGSPAIDLAAPGGSAAHPSVQSVFYKIGFAPVYAWDMVYSSGSPTGYNWAQGTSMASPHAAGVAALIISKNGGPMAPERVEAIMRASADDLGTPGRDDNYGHGRVNALRAVTSASLAQAK
ncbi:S8 family serine peptidase [Hymenobacter sp. BT188]|uniref:S8 family peptidase n=1 Tax=Hymenobacter sp. BT188 TaxID=2763504 RepID=UPI00165186A3|nr:S8 family serine peptidase [Hymenobacter sp. BT188]MBC6608308.1 S8 family serine peptidase [Hymenobacter sp. BT188]